MTTNRREDALRMLYKQLREAKIALGHAEGRPGVKAEELEILNGKIATLDWIIPLVIKAEEEEHAQDD